MKDDPLQFHESLSDLLSTFRNTIASIGWLRESLDSAISFHQKYPYIVTLESSVTNNLVKIDKSIFDPLDKYDFDIVLALRSFHRFLKTDSDHNELVKFLRSLNMKFMFFEPHNQGETEANGTYRSYSPEKSVEFILSNSCLDQAKKLGVCEGKRVLYLLWR